MQEALFVLRVAGEYLVDAEIDARRILEQRQGADGQSDHRQHLACAPVPAELQQE